MSISDLIIVMKDGAIHQVGKPQEVYDDPTDLFVATFLGTPPIHVFDAEVLSHQLFIGGKAVLEAKGIADRTVTAAIRPEGFVLSEDGPFEAELDRVEVMGRDVSVVCRHKNCRADTIRAIIPSDARVDTAKATVRFRLKPHKVFLFDKETGKRIPTEG